MADEKPGSESGGWDGVERRMPPVEVVQFLVTHLDKRLEEQREDSCRRHKEVLDTLAMSVPDGDFEAHRRYHEMLIRREEWRQARRDKILEHLTEKGVVAFLIGLATLVWYGIQVALGRGGGA